MTFCLFIGLAYVSALVPTVFLLPRLGLGRRVRLIVSSAFFLVASRFLVSYLLTGSFSRPPWPGPVVLTWAFLDSTLMAFFLLQLPAYLFFRRLTLRRRRIVAVVLAIAAPCITAAGFFVSMRPPCVNEITLEFSDLPAAFDGYRIAQLSDLHCSPITSRERFEKIVRMVNSAKPDLICLTGDCMDGWLCNLGQKLEPLAGLSAADGVLAVTGNHEYYWCWDEWRTFFESLGIRFLDNAWTNIVRGTESITIAGMPDRCAIGPTRRDEDGRRSPDLEARYRYPEHSAAFAGAPDGFRILLFHRPLDMQFAARDYGVRLQLSGHTHGGAYPGLGLLVGRMNDGFVRGLYGEPGGPFLYVSPGIGQAGCYPLRLFNPSEITVFTLKKALPASFQTTQTALCPVDSR